MDLDSNFNATDQRHKAPPESKQTRRALLLIAIIYSDDDAFQIPVISRFNKAAQPDVASP